MISIYGQDEAYVDVGKIAGVAMRETRGLLQVTGTPEVEAQVAAMAAERGWRTEPSTPEDLAAEAALSG